MKLSPTGMRGEQERYEQMLRLLEARRDEMYAEACAACERIWDENVKRRKGPAKDRLRYLPSVRPGKVGITLEWMRIGAKFSHKQQRYLPRYTKMKRGEDFRIPLKRFTGTTAFEKELIDEIERKVEALRAETEWATKFKLRLDAHPYRRRRQAAERARKAAANAPVPPVEEEVDLVTWL